MQLVLIADEVFELKPASATLFRRLGGLSRWEVGLHAGSTSQPLLKAVFLLGSGAKTATLALREKKGDLLLAEKLRLVSGEEVETGIRIDFSEAAFAQDHLETKYRAHTADGTTDQKLDALFSLIDPSVRVDDTAKDGLLGTPAPVLLQDGESMVELVARTIAAYALVPGVGRITVTGRAAIIVVPENPTASAREVGKGFELVAIGSEDDLGIREGSEHGLVPVVVLGRKQTGVKLTDAISEALSTDTPLPWRAKVALGKGKGAGQLVGTVVWVRDTFRVSSNSLIWEQRIGVRPDGWPPPLRSVASNSRLVFGTIVEGKAKKSQHLVHLKLDGYESGYDTIPVQLLSPYTGIDGKSGLHFLPEPGTRAAAVLSPRPDHIPVLLGNLRGPEVIFPAPSIVISKAVTVAGGAKAEFNVLTERGVVVSGREEKFVISATAEGITVDAKDMPIKVAGQQVQVTSKQPVKVNNVELTFQ